MSVTTVNQSVNNTSTTPNFAKEKSANEDRDQFLLLLTTQLQNQDPTEPADTNQVTQQIAALSQVEQQTKTNGYLQELISLFQQSQSNDTLNYIGRKIDAKGDITQLRGDQAVMHYTLPSGVTKAEVTIYDSKGAKVFTGLGTTLAGKNTVIWDGKNSFTEDDMADGNYKFEVAAIDGDNEEVTVNPIISGIVQAVDYENGEQRLSLGGYSVPFEDILSVYDAQTTYTPVAG